MGSAARPLSVSVASNVPGHEDAWCYVTDGDSETLVTATMTDLETTSDAAFDLLKPRYKHVFDKLKKLQTTWDEATSRNAEEMDDEEVEEEQEAAEEGLASHRKNPYSILTDKLLVWLHQMPVIGFNSISSTR